MIISHKAINFQVILAANPTVMYMGRSYETEAPFWYRAIARSVTYHYPWYPVQYSITAKRWYLNIHENYRQKTIIQKSIVQIRWTILVTGGRSPMVCHGSNRYAEITFSHLNKQYWNWSSNLWLIQSDCEIYN